MAGSLGRLPPADPRRHWRFRGGFSGIAPWSTIARMNLSRKSARFIRAKCWLLDHRKGGAAMAAAQPALRALSSLLRYAAAVRALPLWRSLARAAADIVFRPA